MSLEFFDLESTEAQALGDRICEKLPSIYSNRDWRYKCKEFLVTVEYDNTMGRGFVATVVATLRHIRMDCYSDDVEHKHGFLTVTSPRGGMMALEELARMVDAKVRKVEKGTTMRAKIGEKSSNVL